MFRPRIVPVMLLDGKKLVKSIKFKKHNYIGDPINAAKVFNDLRADELVFLDINATKEKRLIPLDFVQKVAEETNMPFAVGGGVSTINDIQNLIANGAEKVVIGTSAVKNPAFIKEAVETFGSSTIVICIDAKKNLFGKQIVYTQNGTKSSKIDPVTFAKTMEKNGAGEIIIQSIECDGKMEGYDIEMIKSISTAVTIPVVALGGAGTMQDLKNAYTNGNANAMASGSLFVYQSKRRGVLINYPEKDELKAIFT